MSLLAEMAKNRGEVLRIQDTQYRGHRLVDLRVHYEDREGCIHPTRKGLTLGREHFAEFAGLVQAAAAKLEAS
jgi:hypothetical protein